MPPKASSKSYGALREEQEAKRLKINETSNISYHNMSDEQRQRRRERDRLWRKNHNAKLEATLYEAEVAQKLKLEDRLVKKREAARLRQQKVQSLFICE
jgi:hypothetical protein